MHITKSVYQNKGMIIRTSFTHWNDERSSYVHTNMSM